MRPPGDVRLALAKAWEQGPAPVRVAADLACVGRAAARYTASRMVDSGQLVVVQTGKPAVLALAGDAASDGGAQRAGGVHQSLDLLRSVMWGDM